MSRVINLVDRETADRLFALRARMRRSASKGTRRVASAAPARTATDQGAAMPRKVSV